MHFYILNRAAQVRAKDGPFGRRKSGGQKFSSRVLKPWDALGKLGQHRIAAHGNPLHYVLQDVQVDRAQAAEAAECEVGLALMFAMMADAWRTWQCHFDSWRVMGHF